MTMIDRWTPCTHVEERSDGLCINCGWSENAHGYPKSQRIVETCESFSLVRRCGAMAQEHRVPGGGYHVNDHEFEYEEGIAR